MDIRAAISQPVVQSALAGAAEGALERVSGELSGTHLGPAEQVLLSTALQIALETIGGKDPMDGSAAFIMAATAYRAAVADWERAKAEHPAKD